MQQMEGEMGKKKHRLNFELRDGVEIFAKEGKEQPRKHKTKHKGAQNSLRSSGGSKGKKTVSPDAADVSVSPKNKKKKTRRVGSDEEARNVEDRTTTQEEDLEDFPTVSIAVAGSIIDNAQSHELATRLAGQIARAATIFRIDEVIVFDDKANVEAEVHTSIWEIKMESGALFLARILRYLEIPQYLRRVLVPKNNYLRLAGLLPPLDAPHHARKHEWVLYREGVTLERKAVEGMTLVDVGLHKPVCVAQNYEPGVRVTVSMGSNRSLDEGILRKVVNSSEPRRRMGLYWGYHVRYASNFNAVFKECPYKDGYDYSIGTSEHGETIKAVDLQIPKFRHLLIAFGGLGGLEENIEEDKSFKGKDARQVFSCYLNTCPSQGSRTIRTEEAVLICLQYFHDPIQRAVCDITRR